MVNLVGSYSPEACFLPYRREYPADCCGVVHCETETTAPSVDYGSGAEAGKSKKEILRFGGRRPETAGQKMDERDIDRRLPFTGNRDEDRPGIEDVVADEAGCDIAVEAAVRAGEDAQLLAQIEDVGRKCEKGDKQNSQKQMLSFLIQIRDSHD